MDQFHWLLFCVVLFILLIIRCNVYPIKVHYVGALFFKIILASIVFVRFFAFPLLRVIAPTTQYAYFFSLLDFISLAMYPLPNILKFFHISMTFITYKLKYKYDTLMLNQSNEKANHVVQKIKHISTWSNQELKWNNK